MGFYENLAVVVGNLTQDPEIREIPSGKKVANLVVATNRPIKKNDKWEEIPTFHRIVVWGKLAEFCANSLKKGNRVYVKGQIENRSYTDKEGVKKYISEIIAFNVIPMSNKQIINEESKTNRPDGSEDVNPDDIPF